MIEGKFVLGAHVHCRDGRCGKMHKVVIDPYTHRVTDLVVTKGFLQKQDRVLPLSVVESVDAQNVYLTIKSQELEQYPRYCEQEFTLPAPGWESYWGYAGEDVVHWSNYYGLPEYELPVVPMIKQRVPEGIDSNLKVIGRDTPVRNLDGTIGHIDHVLVDPQTRDITHLVVHKGILPYKVVIPSSWITHVDQDRVFIQGNNSDLHDLPRYTARPAVEILTELQHRLNIAMPNFSDVTATVENGILRLRGVVSDEAAKREAEDLGRTVEGVIDIDNMLDTNASIEARVTAALQSNSHTSEAVIEVINDRGVITLEGSVESEAVRRAAEEIAESQPGVVAVINALEVRPDDTLNVDPVMPVVAPYLVPLWSR